MPKRTLKIALTDFWPHEAKDAPMTLYKGFFDVLRTKYDLEHSQEPELLFCSDCSVYKIEHKRYNCIKCWLGVEPPGVYRNNGFLCDYAFSPEPTDATHLHYWKYVWDEPFPAWLRGESSYCDELTAHPKDRFCNFCQKTPGVTTAKLRANFFRALTARKHVDSPGILLNNMPSPDDNNLSKLKNKMEFIKHYRFSICFETISAPSFMAEKLSQALMAGSIPIYYGCAKVSEYFNPARIINCHDYDDLDAVIDHVMEVEGNPELYRQYTEQPAVLPDSKLFSYEHSPEAILEHIDQIVERIDRGTPPPITQTWAGRMMILKWWLGAHRITPIRTLPIRLLNRFMRYWRKRYGSA